MAKQTELAQLQGDHHAKVLEAQKLQRALERKEQELADLQQSKDQLEEDLEDLQQQKKKGDKALNVRPQEDISNKAIWPSRPSDYQSVPIQVSTFQYCHFPHQDLNNQLKKLSGEIGEKENALEQQYQEMLDQTKRKLQAHEVTIQRLMSTLADKEQQLQVKQLRETFKESMKFFVCINVFSLCSPGIHEHGQRL